MYFTFAIQFHFHGPHGHLGYSLRKRNSNSNQDQASDQVLGIQPDVKWDTWMQSAKPTMRGIPHYKWSCSIQFSMERLKEAEKNLWIKRDLRDLSPKCSVWTLNLKKINVKNTFFFFWSREIWVLDVTWFMELLSLLRYRQNNSVGINFLRVLIF